MTEHRVLGTSPPSRYRIGRLDKLIAVVLLLGLVALFLWPFTVVVIRPGQVGVVYHLFTTGTDTTRVYSEGLNLKWPWNRVYDYDLRTQTITESVHGLSSDGLGVAVQVTLLFHPQKENAGLLHKMIGPDYVDRLVRPLTIEAVRNIIGKYGPHDLYRLDSEILQDAILHYIKSDHLGSLPQGLIDYESVVLRDIDLPHSLDQAITYKLTEQQNSEAFDYVLERAKKEAERKRIEAIGLQTFYSIVANSLSPQLLTWRGIEATVAIAQSQNTKIVIVGGGKDQLPLILGSDIANLPSLPNPPTVDPASHPLPSLDGLPRLFPASPDEADGADAADPPSPRNFAKPRHATGDKATGR